MSNSVSVTESNNTVTVNETTNEVTVTQGTTSIVNVVTEGPQGQVGPQGIQGPAVSGFDFDGSAKVNKSVVYYDSTSGKFKADNTWTTSTLVFGGDF
tara:strand:- start:5202 stop:5492 length:291 start_codon:yes stop_codon:yes gene_type:complete